MPLCELALTEQHPVVADTRVAVTATGCPTSDVGTSVSGHWSVPFSFGLLAYTCSLVGGDQRRGKQPVDGHRSLRKSSVTWGSWREIVITRSVTATTFAISRPSSFCPGTSVSSSSNTATRNGVLVGTQHAR